MADADEFFSHKKVDKEKIHEKIKEELVAEGVAGAEEEWFIEDPDENKDRVSKIKLHDDYEFTTGAS